MDAANSRASFGTHDDAAPAPAEDDAAAGLKDAAAVAAVLIAIVFEHATAVVDLSASCNR